MPVNGRDLEKPKFAVRSSGNEAEFGQNKNLRREGMKIGWVKERSCLLPCSHVML